MRRHSTKYLAQIDAFKYKSHYTFPNHLFSQFIDMSFDLHFDCKTDTSTLDQSMRSILKFNIAYYDKNERTRNEKKLSSPQINNQTSLELHTSLKQKKPESN